MQSYQHTERTQLTIRDQFYRESDGTWYDKDDIIQAVASVYDTAADDTPVYREALVLDETFFDVPQLGADWDKDDAGYNFKWTAPSRAFPKGGHVYRIDIALTVTSAAFTEASAPVVRSYQVETRGRA